MAGNVKVINRHNIWTKLQALEYIEGLNIVRKAQAFWRTVNVIPGPIGIFRRAAIECFPMRQRRVARECSDHLPVAGREHRLHGTFRMLEPMDEGTVCAYVLRGDADHHESQDHTGNERS